MKATGTDMIDLGRSDSALVAMLPAMANRHGIIAGATGTGKTVTLQVMAEAFSRIGVPVFTADVKGDLAGLGAAGISSARMQERLAKLAITDHPFEAAPVELWDFSGESGVPIRTSLTEMGPLLLARVLGCSEAQESVLQIVYKIADDRALPLLDLKDLTAMLGWLGEHRAELASDYGAVTSQVLNVIQRKVITLSTAGGGNKRGDQFFGEPSMALDDLMRLQPDGRGVVNILDSSGVMQDPRIYSSFLLWILSELFEQLEEVGDQDKPKLIFFFDEAHLLFEDASSLLVERIERVVKLIRSKGVGIFFVTQNPADIPESILAQLGHRVQHALRAYTPKERKSLRAAADGFRTNPAFDTEQVLEELSTGEALVSVLDEHGVPRPVERTLIMPPRSRIGTLTAAERSAIMNRSAIREKYVHPIDRESAYEILSARANTVTPRAGEEENLVSFLEGSRTVAVPRADKPVRRGDDLKEAFMKSAVRSIGSSVGRTIVRGVLGSIFGRR